MYPYLFLFLSFYIKEIFNGIEKIHGFFTGLFHSVGRSVIGALDIATFLIPTTPIVNPPYIWDNFDRETTYTAWKMR